MWVKHEVLLTLCTKFRLCHHSITQSALRMGGVLKPMNGMWKGWVVNPFGKAEKEFEKHSFLSGSGSRVGFWEPLSTTKGLCWLQCAACTCPFSTRGWCLCPLSPGAHSPSEFWLGAQNQRFPLSLAHLTMALFLFLVRGRWPFLQISSLQLAVTALSLTLLGLGEVVAPYCSYPWMLHSPFWDPVTQLPPLQIDPLVKPQECANCFLLGLDQCSC